MELSEGDVRERERSSLAGVRVSLRSVGNDREGGSLVRLSVVLGGRKVPVP